MSRNPDHLRARSHSTPAAQPRTAKRRVDAPELRLEIIGLVCLVPVGILARALLPARSATLPFAVPRPFCPAPTASVSQRNTAPNARSARPFPLPVAAAPTPT